MSRINRYSKKRAAENRIYSKRRKKFLEDKDECEAKLEGCSWASTQVHHKKGRCGDNYLDVKTWLAVCHNCHTIIEKNPEFSKELGLSENRL
jgi:hypothetical protein